MRCGGSRFILEMAPGSHPQGRLLSGRALSIRCLEGLVTAAVAEDLCGEQVVPAVVLDGQPPTAIPKVRRRRDGLSGAAGAAAPAPGARRRTSPGAAMSPALNRSPRVSSPVPPGRGRFPADSGGGSASNAAHRWSQRAHCAPPTPAGESAPARHPWQTRSPAGSTAGRGRATSGTRADPDPVRSLRPRPPNARTVCPTMPLRRTSRQRPRLAQVQLLESESHEGGKIWHRSLAAVTCEIQAPGDAADSARASRLQLEVPIRGPVETPADVNDVGVSESGSRHSQGPGIRDGKGCCAECTGKLRRLFHAGHFEPIWRAAQELSTDVPDRPAAAGAGVPRRT